MKNYKAKSDTWDYTNYYDTALLDSGQAIRIEFQEDWSNSKYYYNIYLVISDKKKNRNNTFLKSMGKDGIKGLLWAKKKVIEFESIIKEEHKGVPIVIYTTWDDNRRRNVYARGLKNIGYKFNRILGYKALYKEIKG